MAAQTVPDIFALEMDQYSRRVFKPTNLSSSNWLANIRGGFAREEHGGLDQSSAGLHACLVWLYRETKYAPEQLVI